MVGFLHVIYFVISVNSLLSLIRTLLPYIVLTTGLPLAIVKWSEIPNPVKIPLLSPKRFFFLSKVNRARQPPVITSVPPFSSSASPANGVMSFTPIHSAHYHNLHFICNYICDRRLKSLLFLNLLSCL